MLMLGRIRPAVLSASLQRHCVSLHRAQQQCISFSASASAAMAKPDYTNFLSAVSKRREPSAIRALQPLLAIDGMISLGGGTWRRRESLHGTGLA